jgi:hypothetical protein
MTSGWKDALSAGADKLVDSLFSTGWSAEIYTHTPAEEPIPEKPTPEI